MENIALLNMPWHIIRAVVDRHFVDRIGDKTAISRIADMSTEILCCRQNSVIHFWPLKTNTRHWFQRQMEPNTIAILATFSFAPYGTEYNLYSFPDRNANIRHLFYYRKEPNIIVYHFHKYKQTSDICFSIVRSRKSSLLISKSISKHPTFVLAS